MKTAMQELIERLAEKQFMWDKKSKEHIDIANTYYVAIIMAKKLLEKEKEQILAAYNNGSQDMAEWGEEKYEPLEYYNQTYNQNK